MYFCCGFHVSCIRYLCTGRSRNYINLFPVHSWLQYTVQYCTADLQPYYISVLELRHILEQVMQSVYSLGTSRHSSLGMLQHSCLVLSQHFSFGTSLHIMIGMFSHIWRGSFQHVFGNLITCTCLGLSQHFSQGSSQHFSLGTYIVLHSFIDCLWHFCS